eukprot:2040631-Prorocentrum_lima.AAC.1
MTSSLVGSEMCIRDRPTTGLSRMSIAQELQMPVTRVPATLAQLANWLEAVSYTHLTLPTICSV